MKIINLLGFVIVMLVGVYSCSKDKATEGESDPLPKVKTPLQVEATISRTFRDDGYIELLFDVSIRNNDIPVNSATVSVNGTNIPRVVGFIDGWYSVREYDHPTPSYVPGQSYTVTVQFEGKTYTESEMAPGGITANSDFTKVEWTYNGRYGNLDVRHYLGSGTYFAPSTSPKLLTTPQTIPSTAYPSPGTYVVYVSLQNIKEKTFGTLYGDDCYINVFDYKAWRVTK